MSMSMRWRENAVWVALAGACSAAMAWVGLTGYAWSDYETEALLPVEALVHGHLHAFFASAPVYGGSLLERAPFALMPGIWGGGELAVYRMLALPCLLGSLLLGVWLVDRLDRQGASVTTRAVTLLLCVANPLTYAALEFGHPEELLGGVLCVTAVLLALRERPIWAGVALGAAIANKQWALLALGPVMIALPSKRILCIVVTGAAAGVVTAPFFLAAPAGFNTEVHGAAMPDSTIFHIPQLWWFFGHQGHGGYRTAPPWASAVSHPLIMFLGIPLTLAALARDKTPRIPWKTAGSTRKDPSSGRRESQALLLLALLLLLRCTFDTWDNVYYPLPFVLALAAWESLSLRRVPVLAITVSVAVWGEWAWLPHYVSADAGAAFFAAWSVPLALGLGWVLYRRRAAAASGDDREVLGQTGQQLVLAVG